ncbi:MAG: preprotein translocase subunit YajC [Myxococcota bacterium]|jgi:preprotein translocase subunit YajC|nr:preprotein translocase subunit YajC [Myxococcota bacterium]
MNGMLNFLLPIALIFAVFYFFVIRPEKKRMRAREQMLSEIKTGDKIVTNSGILGTVSGMKGDVMTLLVSDKVRVRMLKTQIAGLERDIVKGEVTAEASSEKK